MKERGFKDYFNLFKRDLTQFVELKLEYYKLEFVDILSTIFSKFIGIGVALIVGFVFIIFLLIALAFYLGSILGAYHWGFLIVAGVFLIIAVIFLLLRDKFFTNPLINTLVGSLFERKINKENRKQNGKKKL